MKKTGALLFLIFFIFLSGQFVYSQDKSEADTNFDDENYEVARDQYAKIWRRDAQDVHVNYRLGICYIKTNDDKTKAIKYLEFVKAKKNAPNDVDFYLGLAYFHKHKFDEAIKMLNGFLESKNGNNNQVKEAKQHLIYCENAKELVKNPLDVTFINMGKNVNTKRGEFLPFVNLDETHLVYSSTKKYSSEYQMLISSVYYSTAKVGDWAMMRSIGSKVNTEENEECVAYVNNGEAILLKLDHFNAYHDIFLVTKKGNYYKNVHNAGPEVNSKFKEGGAALTANMDTLIFSSDRPGGHGGFDLYYSVRLPNGEFGVPINMGPGVNTEFDENYPMLSLDGKTLHFCSKGYNSMGGYDVFVCQRKNKDMSWSQPKNIGYPLNNTYDNYNIAYTNNDRYAYVSMFREGGFGNLDIYKVVFNSEPRPDFVYTGSITVDDGNDTKISDYDKSITIETYLEGSSNVYGRYLVNPSSGNYVISLSPGKYELIIKGEKIEDYKRILHITEKSAGANFKTMHIKLKPKVQEEGDGNRSRRTW